MTTQSKREYLHAIGQARQAPDWRPTELIAKQRSGSKLIKRYDHPKTHYQRVLEFNHITKKT